MKKKKNNTKLYIILGVVFAILIAVLSYFLFLREEEDYSYIEKKWISENSNKIIDVYVNSELPVFAYAGDGVYYEFISELEEDTGLKFNTVTSSTNYRLDAVNEKEENDIVFFEDHFVIISEGNVKLASLDDLKGKKIGVLSSDSSYLKYYLSNVSGVSYVSYESFDNIEASLGDSIELAVVPLFESINKIVSQDYNVAYHLDDLKTYYTLTLSENDTELNSIFTKFFKKWDDVLISKIGDNLMEVYYDSSNTSDLNRQSLKSKDYVVGYVENLPYEGSARMKFTGITDTYLENFSDLTGVTFKYNEYRNAESLNKALSGNDIDLLYNYKNFESASYSKSEALNSIDYVVLAHENNSLVLNTIYGLKNYTVKMQKDTILTTSFRSKNIFSISEISESKNIVKKLSEDDIIILEKEVYEYYKAKLENFTVRYESSFDTKNAFLLYQGNTTFNDVFNFYLKIISPKTILNEAISNTRKDANGIGLLGFIIEQRAYFICGAIVLGYVLYKVIAKKKKVDRIKKEDKLIYRDKLTNLKNRNYLNDNIDLWDTNKVYPQAVITIDLNSIKYINDTAGHEEGDRQIQAAANILIKNQRENSEIIRTDGNEFLIYLVGYEEKIITTYMNRLSKEFKKLPYNYGASLGYSMITSEIKTIDDAINDALGMMRESKGEGEKSE